MSNSIFTARMFTSSSSDFIYKSGGFRPEPGRHACKHECPVEMTSGVSAMAGVVFWFLPPMFFGRRVARLETFPKGWDWFWLSADPFVAGSLTPVPAYVSLPNFTHNPFHMKEYQ
jgi:hypothetical protein